MIWTSDLLEIDFVVVIRENLDPIEVTVNFYISNFVCFVVHFTVITRDTMIVGRKNEQFSALWSLQN